MLGVAGLMRAYRKGTVALANAIGTGVADDKAVYAYVPRLIRYYLDRGPDHRQCRDPDLPRARRPGLHAGPSGRAGGQAGRRIGRIRHHHRAARDQGRDRARPRALLADPANYISQPVIDLSVAPTLIDGAVEPRHVDLRPFAVTGRTTWVLPGGLSRVALKRARSWSTPPRAVAPRIPGCWRSARHDPPPRRSAENLFWLARYIERAENLARILDVQETFARDSGGSQDWRLVLVINADAEAFFKRHAEADRRDRAALLHHRARPTRPRSSLRVHAARENARALRPLISTEMWTQLNMLYNRLLALKPADVAEEKLSRLCDWIKRGCDAHTGITAGTFYRDEGWCFYQLGAAIECADQTTRLLDAKFLNFMAQADSDPGSAADSFYWMALLRSAAGYQAFRRRHPRGMEPEQVAASCSRDPCFPRSVACCLGVIDEQLTALRRLYNLKAAGAALEFLDEIRDDLEVRKVQAAIASGELHRFNDFLQRSFSELTTLIARASSATRRWSPAEVPAEPPSSVSACLPA